MPSEIRTDATGTKAAFYGQVCEQLDQLLGGEENFVANAANTSALLYQLLPDVNWAGFYITEGDELVLGPFQGKPACARLNFGQGVCGSAVAEGETIVVPDVSKFSGHIACDAASQSEIVVPLLSWGNVVGVLDIDSASLNRFDEEDQEGLESVVSVFLAHSSGQLPDLGGDAAE